MDRINETNLRTMLKELGVGDIQAGLAIQSMFFLPRSTDADAASTMVIIQAIQRGMKQLGCSNLEVDGRLGPDTVDCLNKVSGSKWPSKTWAQLCGDVISMRDTGRRISQRTVPRYIRGDLSGMDDGFGKLGILLLMGGAAYLALKYKK